MGEKFLQCLVGFTHVRAPGISLCSEEAPQTEPRCLPCLLVPAFPLLGGGVECAPLCNFPEGITDILERPALFDTRTLKWWPHYQALSTGQGSHPKEWLGGLLASNATRIPVTGSKIHGDPLCAGCMPGSILHAQADSWTWCPPVMRLWLREMG